MDTTKDTGLQSSEATQHKATEKDRTSVRCVADAWKMFALQPRTFLRPLWLYCLPAALAFAALTPALLKLIEKQALSQPFTLTDCLWGIIALALFAAFSLYRKAAVLRQISYYKREGTLPKHMVRLKNGALHKAVLRILSVDLPIYIIGMALTFGIGYAAIRISGWLSLCLLVLFFTFPLLTFLCEQRCLVYGRGAWASIREAMALDMRSYGSYFVIALLAMIPLGLFVGVALLPAMTVLFSWYHNLKGMLMGDANGLPPYFSGIIMLCTFIGFYFSILTLSLHTWALALKSVRKAEQA